MERKLNYDAFPALSMEINTKNFSPQTFDISLEIGASTLSEMIQMMQNKKYRDELGQVSRNELKKWLAGTGLIIDKSGKLTRRQKVVFNNKIIAN